MSAITSSQSLEQPPQPAVSHPLSQRWEFLKPQKELLKNLGGLVAAQLVTAAILGIINEAWDGSPDSIWKFSIETHNTLSQFATTFFLAGLFTGFSSVFTWAYFVKSNQETFNREITPETRIAIKNQIERAFRASSNS